jgi:hypothetical protein
LSVGWPIIEDPAVVEERERRRWDKPKPTGPEQLPSPGEDIPPKIVLVYKPPTCPECGGRLDLKPVMCISRLHLMKYEQRRESARLRQAKHRRSNRANTYNE